MRFSTALSLSAGLLAVHASTVSRRAVVNGKAFDRIVHIWLENTNYAAAFADPNLQALAKRGISLTNYYGLTHPSEPNYVAAVGGEYFGMNSDNVFNVPSNVATIVDLLEDKGISWAEYQEDMPSTGYQGTSSGNYVRKHNPLVIHKSVTLNANRLANLKTGTAFAQDLAANTLPQWIFYTPNMSNDGHDTGVTFAGSWVRGFLEPLLANPNFDNGKTLVVLTFDENSFSGPNRVFSMLLGGAVPPALVGTTDTSFYTHYSSIATVEANWGLYTLGRWDVGANVFNFVAQVTGDVVRKTSTAIKLTSSYAGIFNSGKVGKQAVPNTTLVVNGRAVLPVIQSAWGSQQKCTVYTGQLVPADGTTPPVVPVGC